MRPITEIIIHCAATKPSMDVGAKEIDSWHRARGWSRIGYHFVIRRNGAIELGRPLETAGAHVEGRNSKSIGICLVGGLDDKGRDLEGLDRAFTPAQAATLAKLVADMKARYPNADVLGHRDTGAKKSCPCFDVRKWWATAKEAAHA